MKSVHFSTSVRLLAASISLVTLSGILPAIMGMSSGFAHGTYSTVSHDRSQCSDGIDNDGNGKFDYPEDAGCLSLDDNYEGITQEGVFVSITDGKKEVHPIVPITPAFFLVPSAKV